jgi:SAM-dependent methyltransferase
MHLAVRVGLSRHDPVRWRLAPHRREAMHQVLAAYQTRAAELGPDVAAGRTNAIERYDALVAQALDEMRAMRPPKTGGLDTTALLDAIDRPLLRNVPEVMDDPSFPQDVRAEALDVLDRLNEAAGSYQAFLGLLMPLVEAGERAGRRPVRVHDVAAGHGGFAIYLGRLLGERVALEASDVAAEYLALGEARAAALGIPVGFRVVDALAPKALRGADVVTCTQSLHHFTPGMVARLIGEAAREARVGALLVDGERSWLTWGVLTPVAALYGRTYAFVHDAAVSVRRMFYEEELGLLAGLAPMVPGTARVETGTASPAHTFVRIANTIAAA